MVTVAVSQPTFLPWMGYFELISQSDVFVFLDSVQFEKQSWQSRNRIRTPAGELLWLSVPVQKASLSTLIKDVEIAPNPPIWRKKQLKTIRMNLQKAPFLSEADSLVASTFELNHTSLVELNIDFIRRVSSALGLETEFFRSSEVPVDGRREDLILNLCKHFGGARYYSNAGSAVYLEAARDRFLKEGVRLEFQDFQHPVYDQSGEGFISHLSILDSIASIGTDGVKGFLSDTL